MASPTSHPISTFADAKHHYTILDALRGVAAITVVLFHLCESHATSRYEQIINHGYLAVDFFLHYPVLSSATPMMTAGVLCRGGIF